MSYTEPCLCRCNNIGTGFDGNQTTRNSPSIVNAAFQTSYFWDGRIAQLEDMVLLPLNNHIEMGIEKIENLGTKLGATSYYPKLFAGMHLARQKLQKINCPKRFHNLSDQCKLSMQK